MLCNLSGCLRILHHLCGATLGLDSEFPCRWWVLPGKFCVLFLCFHIPDLFHYCASACLELWYCWFAIWSVKLLLQAGYVTVVEDRPIMSVKYCLPVPVFHFWPKLMHPAAQSLCNSWAICNETWEYCWVSCRMQSRGIGLHTCEVTWGIAWRVSN